MPKGKASKAIAREESHRKSEETIFLGGWSGSSTSQPPAFSAPPPAPGHSELLSPAGPSFEKKRDVLR